MNYVLRSSSVPFKKADFQTHFSSPPSQIAAPPLRASFSQGMTLAGSQRTALCTSFYQGMGSQAWLRRESCRNEQ
jgi:hypothetical protein